MSLSTAGDIITEVLVRNNRTTTDSFITDAMLQDWLRDAHVWANSLKKWPFTEGRSSTTFVTTTNEDGYIAISYPEGWKADSTRLMTIGGKQLKKTNFYEFQTFLENNTGNTERIFTDRARTYLVNPGIDVSGTLVVWGQYTPSIDPTDTSATTLFSGYDEEGNEALVEKMTSFMKRREHIPDEAELHDNRARAKLEEVWGRVADEQFAYHGTDGDGMFKRFSVIDGTYDDGFKRDQF